jgi:acyl-CoA hydrolase
VPDFEITDYLKAGDTVLVGQAAAEPPTLVERFVDAAGEVGNLTALCGYTLSDAWGKVTAGKPAVRTYVAHGSLRDLSAKGLLDIVPWNYSRIEELITTGQVPVDVVLLQVGPADEDGYHDLGATVDYAAVAAEHARAVLVEVNPNMPRTKAARRLHRSRVTASIPSDRPLAGSPARPPNEAELRVAARTAELIPSGATLQLGASALADAIAGELRDRRDLRVRSGLVGDWIVDLFEAGALDTTPGSSVVGMALGTERLYRFLGETDVLYLAPLHDQISAEAMARSLPFVSVNSAIEVDLLGQINSEVIGGRYVGAVGGQVDFFRAARGSTGGLAIVALSATSASGTSRIVSSLNGPVTTPKSDIDIVVTEWGAADVRGLSLPERVEALAGIADPRHRADLLAHRPAWA